MFLSLFITILFDKISKLKLLSEQPAGGGHPQSKFCGNTNNLPFGYRQVGEWVDLGLSGIMRHLSRIEIPWMLTYMVLGPCFNEIIYSHLQGLI